MVRTVDATTRRNGAEGGSHRLVARHAFALAACSLALAAPNGLHAASAAAPLGGQFQVNTYTTSYQFYPAVAALTTGGFVVAWDSGGSAGTDGSGYSVQARRYDQGGNPSGGEFQVNTYTTGHQYGAAVTALAGGGFVIAWQSAGSAGGDGSGSSVQAQRYDGDGNPVGGEFQVNTYTTSDQAYPAVAALEAGGFVIAWESTGSAGDDSRRSSIQVRRYDDGGAPAGSEFQVNTYTTSIQDAATVAGLTTGGFVVAWQSDGSAGTDGSGSSVQARRYDGGGSPTSGEFQVNTYTTSDQSYPAVTGDAAGGVVVAWESVGSAGTDDSGSSIQVQRYHDGGAPAGGQLQVNTYTTGNQYGAAVAAESTGGFVVAWDSDGSGGTDDSGFSVQAQRYDAAGSPAEGQFQVNTYTTGNQYDAAIATGTTGGFVVAWASAGSDGSDDSSSSVQAQRYDTGTGGCMQGECNGDGVLSTADVTCVILRLFDQQPSQSPCEDCNGDGLLTTADVTCDILCLFGACP